MANITTIAFIGGAAKDALLLDKGGHFNSSGFSANELINEGSTSVQDLTGASSDIQYTRGAYHDGGAARVFNEQQQNSAEFIR